MVICLEDPKWILGGMGMHVRELYRAMAERGDVEIDLVTQSMDEISELLRQSVVGSKESTEAAQELMMLSDLLRELVLNFKLDEGERSGVTSVEGP